jgi:uncharacterized protein
MLNEYVSFVCEDIAIQYMRRQNLQGALPFHFLKIGRYWDKKSEIDLLAFDQLGNLIVRECEWKKETIGIKELKALKEKSVNIMLDFNKQYFYLFSKSGFDKELIELCKRDLKSFVVRFTD